MFLDIPLRNISYCQDDRKGNNIFCFIAKETQTSPKACYAFKSDNQAGEIMNTIGLAFAKASESGGGNSGSRNLGTPSPTSVSGGSNSPGMLSEVEMMRRKIEQQEREAREMKRRLAELEVRRKRWDGRKTRELVAVDCAGLQRTN